MPSVGQAYAEISDDAPLTAKAIWDALPIESTASTWGDEIYFTIPVQLELENAKEVVNPGIWDTGLLEEHSASSSVQHRQAGAVRLGPQAP